MKIEKHLLNDVKFLLGCCAKKSVGRAVLCGVFIADEKTLVATNGIKLCEMNMGEPITGVSVGDTYEATLVKNELIFVRKIEANYPQYRGIIPVSNELLGAVNFNTRGVPYVCYAAMQDPDLLKGLSGSFEVLYAARKPLLLKGRNLTVVIQPLNIKTPVPAGYVEFLKSVLKEIT
jgi:hypothetical protein